MKMVHGNAVFIREEAKLARNTHLYTFSIRNFTSFNSVTPLSIKQTTPLAAEIICSRDYDMTLGGVAHKSCYLRGVESFAFSQRAQNLKKSSTIKGLKSSS